MQLIFLLTCAFGFWYQTNGEDSIYLKYSNLLIPQEYDEECPGTHKWSKSCTSQKVWKVINNEKIVDNEIASYPTNDVNECIDKCMQHTDCVRATIDLDTCFIGGYDYAHKANQPGWTAIVLMCCNSIQPSKKPNHNLPIVFNPKTDCKIGSIIDECSTNQKVWILHENTQFANSFEEIRFAKRLACMNKCASNPKCYAVEAMWNNECYLNKWKNGKMIEFIGLDTYILTCCNVKQKSLWEKRIRNLPIFYDPKQMCISHELFVGQECKIKIWHATEGGLMTNHYSASKIVDQFKFALCLNKCSESKECVAVSIQPSSCYYHDRNNTNMKYGYNMFTNYQLTCCNMK